jgi:hypothetical protein
MSPDVFISYRRSDLGHFGLWIADRLAAEFGSRSIFIDRTHLPVARNWSESLREALNASTVVMPLVGPAWLTADDKWGRRRLDLDEDIVRLEIATALSAKKRMFPVFLGKDSVPPREALPESIREAFANQGLILENHELPDGADRVVHALASLGLRIIRAPEVVLPDPRKRAEPLTPKDLSAALEDCQAGLS